VNHGRPIKPAAFRIALTFVRFALLSPGTQKNHRRKHMSLRTIRIQVAVITTLLCAASVFGQAPNPYGAPVSVENAKKAAAAALAEARKGNCPSDTFTLGPPIARTPMRTKE
jgi:hypothetical protein